MRTGRRKVVALLASRRKGNTHRLLSDLCARLATHDVEVTVYNLYDHELEDCTGCQRCIFGKRCGLRDHQAVLMDVLRSADGVILATPVYMDMVPGRLKSFIDRTCAWFHRPELVGLPLLTLATTGGSGLFQTLDYMEQVGIRWGMFPTSRIGRTAMDVGEPIAQRDYRAFVEHLHKARHEYAPSLRQLLSFRVQHILAEVLFPVDEAYWREQGWLAEPYYYPCRISPLRRGVAALFHAWLRSKMKTARQRRADSAFTRLPGEATPGSGVVRLPLAADNDQETTARRHTR